MRRVARSAAEKLTEIATSAAHLYWELLRSALSLLAPRRSAE